MGPSTKKKATRSKKKAGANSESKRTLGEHASGDPTAAVIQAPAPNDPPPSEQAASQPEPPGTSEMDASNGEKTADVSPASIEMLTFRLGKEEYAMMIDHVREVIRIWEITPVPNTPEYVIGVTSLRGRVLSIINLHKRLALPESSRDDKSRIVVAGMDDDEIGFIVDRVAGVLRILPDEIRPVPETIEHGAGAEFLRGIIRKNDKLYILLDAEKALGT